MTKINRGKDFEDAVKTSMSKLTDVSIDRLIDPQNGYAGVRNICDFIVYRYPTQFYIECKTCYGNTLPFSNITENQWMGLVKKSTLHGVVSGYLIWFIDHDKTIFITAKRAAELKIDGAKSININRLKPTDYVEIPGKKKRILFDYDFTPLFEFYHVG